MHSVLLLLGKGLNLTEGCAKWPPCCNRKESVSRHYEGHIDPKCYFSVPYFQASRQRLKRNGNNHFCKVYGETVTEMTFCRCKFTETIPEQLFTPFWVKMYNISSLFPSSETARSKDFILVLHTTVTHQKEPSIQWWWCWYKHCLIYPLNKYNRILK